ncbi:unnamed protein product [Discosporangium mesarthrocarpum]
MTDPELHVDLPRPNGLRRRLPQGHHLAPVTIVLSAERHAGEDCWGRRRWRPRKMIWLYAGFLAHVILSFVGVVVVPVGLSYDLLIRRGGASGNGLTGFSASASFLWESKGGIGLFRPPPPTAFEELEHAWQVEETPATLWEARGATWIAGTVESAHGTRAGSGRVLMQAEEEDESYVYATTTKMSLCVKGSVVEASVMMDAVKEVFSVEETQVGAYVRPSNLIFSDTSPVLKDRRRNFGSSGLGSVVSECVVVFNQVGGCRSRQDVRSYR